MESYILKSSLSLFLFISFYWLFLRKDTIFFTNRLYLIFTLVAGFLVPLFHINWVEESQTLQDVNSAIIPLYINNFNPPVTNSTFSWWSFRHVLFLLYSTGICIFLIRYLKQILPWIKLILGNKNQLEGVHFIKVNRPHPPFSFINTIFVGNQNYTPEELRNIVSHEKHHISQFHWVDLFIVNILSIVFWFNPLVWIYDLFIKQNHEYLADNGVISEGFSKSGYQALLLQETVGIKAPGLSNSFNHSLIKNRFIMMTKKNSRKIVRMKAFFALPIITLLVILFSGNSKQPFYNYKTKGMVIDKIYGHIYDLSTKKPLPEASVFYQKNSSIVCSADIDGYFELENKEGYNKILVTHVGYQTKEVDVSDTDIKVFLNRISYPLKSKVSENGKVQYNVPTPPPPPPPINKGETPPPPKEDTDKGVIVEDMPLPQGGFEGLSEYINNQVALNDNKSLKGKKTLVSFNIDEEGKATDIKINKSSGDKIADKVAFEIIKDMPNWKPGSQNGKSVVIEYTIDVIF